MKLTDSRRLTGPNLLMNGPGAAAELDVQSTSRDHVVDVWKKHARRLLDAVDWENQKIVIRLYDGGATVAISAPMDALYVATDIVEAAWDLTENEVQTHADLDVENVIANLRQEIAKEVQPDLLKLCAAASEHNVTLLPDDDMITLGLGKYSRSWPRADVPNSSNVNWAEISDIPVALVTGTNGKSTTVRMAAAIGAAAGKTVGFSSSDWVKAGRDVIDTGDYSGPEGARLALRDSRVDMAVIETARGGLLRRGLPVARATACLVTNVAADHLGEYGILDVDALADTKFIVSKAVQQNGVLVLNADDPRLVARGQSFTGHIAWYGLDLTAADMPARGYGAFVKDGIMSLSKDGEIAPVLSVADFGPALGGAATYNVSNALAAILLMNIMGCDVEALRAGLLEFDSDIEDNPGRGNFMDVGGVKVILDFAHNPHGLGALTQSLSNVPANRRLYLCGQGGDRSDADIYDLVKVIRDADPEAIVIKELPSKLRGRELGEVPQLIEQYLSEMSYPKDQILSGASELDATIKAFEWAKPGDLLVLLVYAERKPVLELIESLKQSGWGPGKSVS